MKVFVVALFALVAGASAAAVPEFIPIVSQAQEVNPDGSYFSQYETANGIVSQEKGVLTNPGQKDEAEAVEGQVSWTSPEGIPFTLRWTAGANGVVFEGAHLPVAPPAPEIPLAIQRSLEWNAAHPEEDLPPKKL